MQVRICPLRISHQPLDLAGNKIPMRNSWVAIVEKGEYGLADFHRSRDTGPENGTIKRKDGKVDEVATAQSQKAAREARARLVKEFDKCFGETPKTFYAKAEKDLDGCLQVLSQLKETCDGKFGAAAPSWGELQSALEETRGVVHGLLEKKREKEPDPPVPIQQTPPEKSAEEGRDCDGRLDSRGSVRAGVLLSIETSSEPADRVEAVRKIAEAGVFLRKREPRSPAPYLMLRGLRWGELRAAVNQSDHTQLEAPPTDLRKHLKLLALNKKWQELLETAENAMALPCSRAWLDLQRYVIEACEALGSDYEAVARAICSELKALVTDIPQLLDAALMDDTPAANSETRVWLKSLLQEAPLQSPGAALPTGTATGADRNAARWPGQPVDTYVMALQSLREGQERKAFEILQKDIAAQRSGRERFRRKMQLVEMCVSTSKQNIAQPILDDLAAAIDMHKLDEWEDPSMVAGALAAILKLSQRIQADKAQQQKLFERICRLDPAQALADGN